MNFSMQLIEPSSPTPVGAPDPLPEGYEPLVMEACGLLSEAGYKFLVSGFGESEWPVNVSYDLSTVMEQLPDTLREIREGTPAQLDFYGQGVERGIELTPNDGAIDARCTSGTDWVPDPEVEHVATERFEELLTGLAEDFAQAVSRAIPALAASEPLADWRTGKV